MVYYRVLIKQDTSQAKVSTNSTLVGHRVRLAAPDPLVHDVPKVGGHRPRVAVIVTEVG